MNILELCKVFIIDNARNIFPNLYSNSFCCQKQGMFDSFHLGRGVI